MSHRANSITKPNALALIVGILLMIGLLGWYVYSQYQTEQSVQRERTQQN